MIQLAVFQSQPMSSGPQMMLNQRYKPWQSQNPNPNPNPNKKFPSFSRNNNWKGKKVSSGKDSRKFNNKLLLMGTVYATSLVFASSGGIKGYKPPTLNELQSQNRLNARKFYDNRKKFNNNNRFAPYAPCNTTLFIIQRKKSGGIASLVSPCPVTPSMLPTPIFSPSREVLGDMAKEELGVDGYGSMKRLIRLWSLEAGHDDEEDEEGRNNDRSSESDVEEHVEVERRLDHDLSRFEMICPSSRGDYNNVLENKVDDQDTHIAQLEEEYLTLKETLFFMERELGDLRRRLRFLQRQTQVGEDVLEEVVENGSDNESEGGGSDVRVVTDAADHTNVEMVELAAGKGQDVDVLMEEDNIGGMPQNKGLKGVCMDEIVVADDDDAGKDKLKNEGRGAGAMRVKVLREKSKGNLAKGDEAGGNEIVGEKVVEEEKDELRCEDERNEADNNEIETKEIHL